MTKCHEWLHPASVMQALKVVEISQNTENQYRINMALVVPYGYYLTESKGQKKEGNSDLAGRLCCNTLASGS